MIEVFLWFHENLESHLISNFEMEDKLYEPAVVNIHGHLFLGPFYREEGHAPLPVRDFQFK